MAQDLLAAVGARIEAQLNAKDARSRTVEEALKARVSKNPPAPFTLLSDGTRQFGYAPSVDDSIHRLLSSSTEIQPNIGAATLSPKTAPTAEEISAAIAPFAALLSGAAQVLTQTAAQPSAATEPRAPESAAVRVPVSVQNSAPTSAPVNVPVAVQFSAPASAPTSTASIPAAMPAPHSPVSTVASTSATASTGSSASPTATAASVVSPTSIVDNGTAAPFVMLPDGTKQFGYAPAGGLINRVPNITPPIPPEFGVGATVRRLGVKSDAPMTVTQADGSFVRATVTDSTGTHIFEFPFNQFELITRAPGT